MTQDEIERLASRYAGSRFRQRQVVRHEALTEYGSREWAFDEFMEMLKDERDSMPSDARDIKVEFEGGGYDESAKFSISYSALESEEVVADRVRRALEYAHGCVDQEQAEYARLKAKFEKQT